MTRLHVGLDLLHLEEHSGGTGTYARELIGGLTALGVRLTAFVGVELPAWFDAQPWRDEVGVVRYDVTITRGPPHNAAKLAALHWAAIPWRAARAGVHVVHGPANVAPLLVPRVATVVTMHDLIWMRHPTLSRRDTIGMKLTALPSARRADRVIAISGAVRDDLQATIGVDPGRVDVVHHGIDGRPRAASTPEPELRERLGLGARPVVLTVGQKRRHKNQLALIRALPEGAALVVPGAPTEYEQTLRAAAEGRAVAFPEWLSDADLEGLYALATCFALPSLEEGFGLPILEAMARGVPVACSDRSSLPEVAGGAAELFDPHDVASVAAALTRLLADADLRERRIAQGRERASAFTWERCSRETLDVYRRAVAA